MGKGMILGIDFSTEFTQLAFLDDDGNPQSVCFGTEDNYLIPTVVCYNKELQEWSAGEEAINKGKLSNSTVYEHLPELFESDTDKEICKKVIFTYMSYLLKLSVNYNNGKLIKNILITVNKVTPQIVEGLTDVFVELGYQSEDIKIITHLESFVYYVLNQNKDIWMNKVYFLELNRQEFVCRKLNVVKGRKPHVANVTLEDLSDLISMDMVLRSPEEADIILSDYMEEQLKKEVVSGIYLSGEGFYEQEWEKTLAIFCRNRRVFKGNNLVVKGAVYGAKEFFHVPVLEQYLISCKGRTRVRVIMNVKHRDRDTSVTLSDIGNYWYQARGKIECIMEKPAEAVFEIQDVMNHRNERFQIDLTEFPNRPPKTTRIEVNFRYLEENRFEIEIKDLGFGELFPSSGMVVRKEVSVYDI